MKLSRIKWSGHPILGDFELNLRNQANVICDTIVIAGENGTGKTTILSAINGFMEGYPMDYIEFIEYVVGDDVFKAVPPQKIPSLKYGAYDVELPKGGIIKVDSGRNSKGIWYGSQEETNSKNIRCYGCVFSKARADYKTNKIESVKTMELDTDKHSGDTNDDYTSLKQLIVDVQNQDNEKYMEINRERESNGKPPMSYGDFEPTSRIFRFKKAFNDFFERVKYNKVGNAGKEKVVLFSKNGKDIPIDKLSTGEKQIVYRGAFLLKNLKQLSGGIIMIDEPELSMHPKWQEKILKYYRDLFPKNGEQETQMIFATHSESVLKSALEDKDNVLVIVLKDKDGTIDKEKITAPFVLPDITSAETNYRAFDVVSNDYHIELYGYLQNKIGVTSIKKCDNYIKTQPVYNANKHEKINSYNGTTYETLPTYIRNAIDHPDPSRKFTPEELRCSIELLIELCK